MKNFKYISFGAISFLAGASLVFAAPTASISVSSKTIENGSTVKATVKVKDAAAWDVRMNCTGATSGNSTHQADADSGAKNGTRTFTLSCKATSTGIIAFTASGDATSADGTNRSISLSQSVSVVKQHEKSKNNYLSSLSVEGFDLTPAFSKDTTEYSVTVPATTTKVNISAKKADSYASLSGTGSFEVAEGTNSFDITVTSETGSSRVYKVVVNVIDQNPINETIDGKKYTVVKKRENLVAPANYEETTVKINDIDIPAYYSSVTKITLVGLKDEEANITYYIYDLDNNKFTKYTEISNKELVVYPVEIVELPSGYEKDTITINEQEVEVLVTGEKSDFVIIYGINIATGSKGYYRYDKKENTIQRFTLEEVEQISSNNFSTYLNIILGALSGFLAVLLIVVGVKSKKKDKIIQKIEEIENNLKNRNKKNNKIKVEEKK